MKRFWLSGMLLAIAGTFLLGACAFRSNTESPDYTYAVYKQSFQDYMLDTKLEKRVFNSLNSLFFIHDDDSYLKVMVFNKRILLLGCLQNEEELSKLEEVLLYFKKEGYELINHLTTLDCLTLTDKIADQNLILQIRSAIAISGRVNPEMMKFTVYKRNVYLMGFVTPDQGRFFEDIISRVKNVKMIYSIFDYVYP